MSEKEQANEGSATIRSQGPEDKVSVSGDFMRLGNALYRIEDIQTVEVVSQLPFPYTLYSWLSGALWAILLLAISLSYVLSGGSVEENWAYVFIGLVTLLTFAAALLPGVSILEQASCLAQFWAFLWTALSGTVLLYLVTTFSTFRVTDVLNSLGALLVAFLSLLNLIASIVVASSSGHNKVFVLRLAGRFGTKDALSSSDEKRIHEIEEQISSMIYSNKDAKEQ